MVQVGVEAACVYMGAGKGTAGCGCLLGTGAQPGWMWGGRTAAASCLQAHYRRNFPVS